MTTKPEIISEWAARIAMTLLVSVMTTVTAWAARADACLDYCYGKTNAIHIQGWAYEKNASSKSIPVIVYIYADEGRTKVYSGPLEVQANVPRPDVNEVKHITGDHGFNTDIPIADAGTYWVKILAIDTQVGEITQVTVTGPPSGALETCAGKPLSIHVEGWAYDPDASSTSIGVNVRVYSNAGCTTQYGNVHVLTANVPRSDVNQDKGITGDHGFSADIPIAKAGTYWVKVFAIDTGGDGNQQIGTTTQVTVLQGGYDISQCTITGVRSEYVWLGGREISISPVVKAPDGTTLVEGQHYTTTITEDAYDRVVTQVRGTGDYTLTVSADNSQSVSFSVVKYWNGAGTESVPFFINTIEELSALAHVVNSGESCDGLLFWLTFDYTYSYEGLADDESNFTPIGNDVTPFKGIFDGRGKTISGIRIYRPDDSYVGLFGAIQGATVKDLTITDAVITGKNHVGGIAGEVTGASTLTNNFAISVTINTVANSSDVGILVGSCGGNSTLQKNYHISCTLDGVTNPTNVATGRGDINGARLGLPVNIPERFSLADDTGTIYNGQVYGGAGEWLTFIVDESDGLYYEYYVTGDATLTIPVEHAYYLAISGDATTDITITSDYADHWGYANGADGTEEHPYVITNTDDMAFLATITNSGFSRFSDRFFKLGNDIAYNPDVLTVDLDGDGTAESNYTPIGISHQINFAGHFDGCGHTISGIRIEHNKTGSIGGLFTKTGYYSQNGAFVTGITLSDARITNHYAGIGGIVGIAENSTVSNCYVKSDVYINGRSCSGGIAGTIKNSNVTNCHIMDGAHINIIPGVSGLSTRTKCEGIGGIAGVSYEYCTISNCTSAAQFTFDSEMTSLEAVGGIVGDFSGTVSNCLALGTNIPSVSTVLGIGAIVGENWDGTLEHNYYVNCSVGGATANIGYSYPDADYEVWTIDDLTANDGAVPAIALYDSGSNASGNATTIADNADTDKNVALYGRTLSKDGTWNTLCLPFGVTIADSPLAGADVRALTSASLANGTLTLNFTEKGALTAIEAGTPYIIRWEKPDGYDLAPSGHDLFSPVFAGVTVSADEPTAFSFTGGKFVGGYAPVALTTSDDLLLGSDNTLSYPPSTARQLDAFRAYLSVPAPIDLPQLKDAVLGKAEPTAASDVNGDLQTDILDITALIDYLTGNGLVKRVVSNVGLDFGY